MPGKRRYIHNTHGVRNWKIVNTTCLCLQPMMLLSLGTHTQQVRTRHHKTQIAHANVTSTYTTRQHPEWPERSLAHTNAFELIYYACVHWYVK